MISRRTYLRSLLVVAAATAATVMPAVAPGQPKMVDGMARGGSVMIRNEAERRAFTELLCMCGGCQRESLAVCNCGIADGYRDEIRAMMAEGLSQEQIKARWREKFGPQALAVPEDKGANRLIYIAPLLLIAAMAAFVVSVLRRFRKNGDGGGPGGAGSSPGKDPPGKGPPGEGRDEYDDKLDEELEQLDDDHDA